MKFFRVVPAGLGGFLGGVGSRPPTLFWPLLHGRRASALNFFTKIFGSKFNNNNETGLVMDPLGRPRGDCNLGHGGPVPPAVEPLAVGRNGLASGHSTGSAAAQGVRQSPSSDSVLTSHTASAENFYDSSADASTFSIFFQNVNGMNAKRGYKLKPLLKRDSILCFNELNKDETHVPFLPRRVASDTDFGTINAYGSKKSGYGTGLVSRIKNNKLLFSSKNNEIIAVSSEVGDLNVLTVCVYRSPSLDGQQNCSFFDEIESVLDQYCSKHDIVTYIGDDNIDTKSKSLAKSLIKRKLDIMAKFELIDAIENMPTRLNKVTGSWNQPDSCLVRYNPMTCQINAAVLPDFCGSDHKCINVNFEIQNFKLSSEKMKTIWKWKKRVPKKGQKFRLSENDLIREKFGAWCSKYQIFVDPNNDWDYLMSDKEVEIAANEFQKCVSNSRKALFFRKRMTVPIEANVRMSTDELAIWHARSQLSSAIRKRSLNPRNSTYLDAKILRLKREIDKKIFSCFENLIQKDLLFQEKTPFTDSSRYHKYAGFLTNKSGYEKVLNQYKSSQEETLELDILDQS